MSESDRCGRFLRPESEPPMLASQRHISERPPAILFDLIGSVQVCDHAHVPFTVAQPAPKAAQKAPSPTAAFKFSSPAVLAMRAQTFIRITFSQPRNIRRIQLVFRESKYARTQEFTLRCIVAGEDPRGVIRQQWTFSPQGSTEEIEDYCVTLTDVVVLELAIVPDASNGCALASLVRLRVG